MPITPIVMYQTDCKIWTYPKTTQKGQAVAATAYSPIELSLTPPVTHN
jgi:hypothetical protein